MPVEFAHAKERKRPRPFEFVVSVPLLLVLFAASLGYSLQHELNPCDEGFALANAWRVLERVAP